MSAPQTLKLLPNLTRLATCLAVFNGTDREEEVWATANTGSLTKRLILLSVAGKICIILINFYTVIITPLMLNDALFFLIPKPRLRCDLYCVEWSVKLYSLTP